MPKTALSDQQLVLKALQDVNAFGKLIERYQEKLLRYILRISHFSEAEAEEILQESFIKAWKNLNDYDLTLSFSSWMYRIVHNQTISSYRKANSRGDTTKVALDKQLFHLSSEEPEFGKQFDQKLSDKKVRENLEKLSETHRNVLILKYFEDKSYQEIADILKKPIGTISTHINRAKKAFKNQLNSSAAL